jgi:di/tripeptidase
VREIIATAPGEGLESQIEVVGERPAGSRPTDDPLVQLATEVLQWIGYEPEYHAASTDANIPINQDITSVCIGVAEGDGAHSLAEYIKVPSIGRGLAQLARLTVEATHLVANGGSR